MRSILTEQHVRKIDVVASADNLRFEDANLRITGNAAPVLSEDGFTYPTGLYRPTDVFDEGLADKLKIPLSYLRRMRWDRPDLYDANANGWLEDDNRSFTVRTYRGDEGENGIARAMLSDRYGIMDNLDVLIAALKGIADTGADVKIDGCDLTDRRMYVRVKAPGVQALAPALLANYRSPFSGAYGADNPTVFAGFVISNSETGNGAFSITPRMIVEVCNNGMTMKRDAMRAVHLGSQKEDGLVKWTQDTLDKELAVVTARARDSVATFLDVEYMEKVIAELSEQSGVKVKDPEGVKVVAKNLGFDKETTDAVFSMFIQGADLTAGGVMHAVTAAARTIGDADKAHDVEGQGVRAMELAAAL